MSHQNIAETRDAALRQCGLEQCGLTGCQTAGYAPGDMILRQGYPLNALYIILAGHVKVCTQTEAGKELTLCRCGPGDILGDVGFMTGCAVATTSVAAIADTACFVIPLSENSERLQNCVPFLNYVGRSLAEKLLNRGDAQTATALAPAKARLCTYVLQTETNGFFREPLTETAQALGVSYRHVFRLLGSLCKDGLMERTQSGYRILDSRRLRSCAEKTP